MNFARKKGFRIAVLILGIVMLITAVSLIIGNYSLGSTIYFTGLGDQRSPYLIETAEDFCRFRDLVNSGMRFDGRFFLQTADIDLSEVENFTPIGTETNCFAGTYNGAGNSIYNLKIIETEQVLNEDNEVIPTALFAQLHGAVQNLNLIDATVIGTKVGGIVGVSMSVGARITNCHSNAMLIGSEKAGGIAVAFEGNIGSCIYNGEMSAPVSGGICAEESYSAINCIAPSIAPEGVKVRYVVNNQIVMLNGELLEAQKEIMRARSTESANPIEQFYYAMFDGRGHQWDPFIIQEYTDLCLLRDLVNAGYSFDSFFVRQTADIDLSAETWTPIGLYHEANKKIDPADEDIHHYFWGIYDGAGHTISNLNVNVPGEERGGLFTSLCGVVMNLGIESGHIQGGYVGSIAVESGSDRAMIFNCYSKAELIGLQAAGGIAHNFVGGSIGNCYFAGTVTAPQSAGVLAGTSDWLSNCYAVNYEVIDSYYGYAQGDRLRVDSLEEAVKKANSSCYDSALDLSMQKYTLYRFGQGGGFDGKVLLTVKALLWQIGIGLLIVLIVCAGAIACHHLYHSKRITLEGCRALWSEQWGKWRQNKLCLLICALFGVCALLTVSALLAGDTMVSNAYVWSHGEDALMDLFNPMKSQIRTNYWGVGFYSDVGETYPPLARALVWLLGQLLPFDTLRQNSYSIRTSSYGILSAMFLAIAVCGILTVVWSKQLKDVHGRSFLIFMILTSPAFVFSLERYNLVLFTFVFCVLFLAGYRSENPFIRHLSYLCLGLAAALKIYPAVLGILVLREKNAKHTVQCITWGAAIFLIPFAFCGGFMAILHYIRNVTTSFTRYANAYDTGVINFSNTLMMFTQKIMGDASIGHSISGYLLYPLTVLLAICGLLTKKEWKSLLAATLILTLFPGFSVYYMAIFYALPLFALIVKKESGKKNVVYALLMASTLAPIGFLCGAVGCGKTLIVEVMSIAGLLMALLLIVDCVIEIVREKAWRDWFQKCRSDEAEVPTDQKETANGTS